MEWLKVQALCSSPSTTKKKKKKPDHLHNHSLKNSNKLARYQWLILITLAPQEAEIRKVTVRSQPGQIAF
jgi:hypothetical protein